MSWKTGVDLGPYKGVDSNVSCGNVFGENCYVSNSYVSNSHIGNRVIVNGRVISQPGDTGSTYVESKVSSKTIDGVKTVSESIIYNGKNISSSSREEKIPESSNVNVADYGKKDADNTNISSSSRKNTSHYSVSVNISGIIGLIAGIALAIFGGITGNLPCLGVGIALGVFSTAFLIWDIVNKCNRVREPDVFQNI